MKKFFLNKTHGINNIDKISLKKIIEIFSLPKDVNISLTNDEISIELRLKYDNLEISYILCRKYCAAKYLYCTMGITHYSGSSQWPLSKKVAISASRISPHSTMTIVILERMSVLYRARTRSNQAMRGWCLSHIIAIARPKNNP